jgi:uncharacterized integral membrane protein
MTQTPNESGRVPVEPPNDRRRGGRGGATPSRLGSLWVASILFAVVLLLLLIFVLQNGQDAKVQYFGAHGSLPQGVALLLAAVFGILLVALPGTARIIQLRIRDRRYRGAARTRPTDAQPTNLPPSDAPPTDAPPTQAQPRDVTPPAIDPPATSPPATNPLTGGAPEANPLTGGAPEANAPSTNAPTTPLVSPPGPPAQPPAADAR